MNPQIRFGEDLMSRVSYVMMNPGGEVDLTRVVREAINELVGEVCADAGVDRNAILECTFVGNPVMHHLLLGINPVELGGAPFALATSDSISMPFAALDMRVPNPRARLYILPCIAGHVGADAAAVALSEEPHKSDDLVLVDPGRIALNRDAGEPGQATVERRDGVLVVVYEDESFETLF
jgi:uncharacterized 2Fe-2S/4Fe-4S cluster protein (DUF4445 family)